MERIERPNPLGKFAWLDPVIVIAIFTVSVWLATNGPAGTFWDGLAGLTIGALVVSLVMRLMTGPPRRASGVDLDGRELVITVEDEMTTIPVAEATVRTTTEVHKGTTTRRTRVFVDHSSGSTEVDTEGMMPIRIREYADKLSHVFSERRRVLLLPDPPALESSTD